jgi:hypothetical protein
MNETFPNHPRLDRRSLLVGSALLAAGGALARLELSGWTGAQADGPTFVVAAREALEPGERAQLVLHGDRLHRLSQLRAMLANERPRQVVLKIDAADRIMLDIAQAQQGVRGEATAGGIIALTYGKGIPA